MKEVFTLKDLEKILGAGVSLLKKGDSEHSCECPLDCDCADECDECIGDTDSCGEGNCPIG